MSKTLQRRNSTLGFSISQNAVRDVPLCNSSKGITRLIHVQESYSSSSIPDFNNGKVRAGQFIRPVMPQEKISALPSACNTTYHGPPTAHS